MKAKKIIFLTLGLIYKLNLIGMPFISNVVISPTNNVSSFEKFEITFNMNYYSNPYDPDVINSYCEFWSPSGKYYKVYAFYYSDYTKTSSNCSLDWTPYQCEILTQNGINNWKIRFTPDEVGNWQYKITATDSYGNISYPGRSTLNFLCVKSSNNGFIIKANSRFLKKTTGEFFFPVGQNIAWYNYPNSNGIGVQTYGTNEYKHYIDAMADSKANFIRIFLDYYEGIALIGYDFTIGENYFDLYNQKDSYQLDWIFNYAKSKGINIMLCLFSHSSWGNTNYCSNAWAERNPFNSDNGGPISTPFEFFSNSVAINKTKKLLRYIISRWAYSTNLVAWELWNEVYQIEVFNPQITPPSNYLTNINDWHANMYNYIKSIDPYKHLITTSYGAGINNDNYAGFSVMDFTQSHDYKNPIETDFQNYFYQTALYSTYLIDKPYMSGEWGFDPSVYMDYFDPNGFELHNSLWSSSFSTSLGAVSNWWWDYYINKQNLFHMYKPISEFMNSLSTPSNLFHPYKISNLNGLCTYYMKNSNNDTIYGWTQDINFNYRSLRSTANGIRYLNTLDENNKPNPSSSNNEIHIPVNQNNKQYIVKWYNTETGIEFQSNTIISNNDILKLDVPTTLRTSTFGDAVFAIYLDCDNYIWREGVLNNNTYQNVSENVVCNKSNGQVFYKTFDNKIQSLWWDQNSNTWQWSELNQAANNVAGDLAITQDGSQIFYRTTTNKINSIWWNSSIQNWQWSELNQAANGNVKGPIAVSSNGQVFYRTLDNKLNNIWWNTNNNSWEWSNLNNSTKGNVGDAIVISYGGNVIYKTIDNKLNDIWWSPSTGTWIWSNLNNAANSNVCGNITITLNGEVFYRTCDNKFNYIWWDESNYLWKLSTLNNIPNNVAGDLMYDNFGKVFYRSTNSNVYCVYWANNSWNWSELNNSTNCNASPGNLAIDNQGNVFFRGSDNLIHRLYYKSQCDYTPSTNFQKNTPHIEELLQERAYNNKINDDSHFIIYPNPADNQIILSSKSNINYICIYNLEGKLISKKTNLNESEVEIDVSKYINGFYFVKVYLSNKKIINNKIIVKH